MTQDDLLQRARRLDEEALAVIFDTFYEPLYRYIYHRTGHVSTAEDLAADVFTRLLEQFKRGRGPDRNLKAWLYRVARNLVVDEARRSSHRTHAQLDADPWDEEQNVEREAQRSILSTYAREALEKLTPNQRDVVILKYLEGLDNAEVSQTLGMSVGAVKALQHRGLAALRRHLVRSGALPKETTA